VNTWFDSLIESRNQATVGWGTQMRQMIQLLKRFCRSRNDWDLPNGMKLTMLIAECQPAYDERIDNAFRVLLKKIKDRLLWKKVIQNLAHPDKPAITRTASDQNVIDLEAQLSDALDQLATLDKEESDNVDSARAVWDWIFKSDGFFADFDRDQKQQDEKKKSLLEKAVLVGAGARTSPAGILGSIGIANAAHGFHGDEIVD
ncbi:MAG: hypothetical protein M0Q93_11425, partial [Terrimicrobiaceae bacterium]|nr:hypothetical protein [Terrimicrobiaceae bacterium]